MEPPFHGGDNAPVRQPMPPSKSSSARKGMYLVESLGIGVPWIPRNIRDYCQGYLLFPLT